MLQLPLTILLSILSAHQSLCLDNSKLIHAGIMSTTEREVNVYAQSITGSIVVRLIPNIPSNHKSCATSQIKLYNDTLTRLLTPIKANLEGLISAVSQDQSQNSGKRKKRFVGAVIGAAALGLATAAQVTATVALNQAQENARNILRLKNSIQKTNEAVMELKDAVGQTAVAIDKTQAFINNQILPAISNLSCEVLGNKIGVQLSLYLTELTTVFGNQLTNPALTTLSLQALYNLCGDDFNYLINLLNAKNRNLASLYEANLIQGRITQYDSMNQLLIIQVQIPSISTVSGMRVTELFTLSVDTPIGEGKALVPKYVLSSGRIMEEVDLSSCAITSTSVFCSSIISRPLPLETINCLNGNVTQCQFTANTGTLESRYAVIGGLVIANCKAIVCRCLNPPGVIAQNLGLPITIISSNTCQRINLEQITLSLGNSILSTYSANLSQVEMNLAPSNPLDISVELNRVNTSLSKVESLIKESNSILDSVNPQILNVKTVIILAVIIGLIVVWCFILTCLIVRGFMLLVKQQKFKGLSVQNNPYVSNNSH
ncbi:fusion protein [avian paramyxovirus 5]|uniref:Fusion glycoprotein F0 n=1 Tax=avian paramyxovirus 5 TaxID=2560315 RepID=D3X607_9MONO|nr:fusion protein [Avian metaavulavirus 5]ADD39004.1 fusion protein [Avian metaavulavirus 5]